MNRPFFSIIIPVYNVENYLEECVNSILVQTFNNIEIILIDDGSTDSSSYICDKFAKKYSVIKVIHKTNGGLSDARNIGTKHASGEYIIYIDSDDYISDKDFLKYAFDFITKKNKDIDLLVYGYNKFYSSEKKKIMKMSIKEEELECSMDMLCAKNLFIISAWGKIVKRSILIENDIYFRKGVYSEDMEWCAKLLFACNRCGVLNKNAYEYRQRQGSISKRLTYKNLVDVEDNIIRCLELAKQHEESKGLAFQQYLSKNISMYYIVLSVMDKAVWKKHYQNMDSWKIYLKNGNRSREKIMFFCTEIIGKRMTLTLLNLVQR